MCKIRKTIVFFAAAFTIGLGSLFAQKVPLKDMYLAQQTPGDSAVVFCLPVITGMFDAERIAISKDGSEIYYMELDGYTELDGKPHNTQIKCMRYDKGVWNGPVKVFEGFGAPALSVSGDTMYLEKNLKQAYYSVRSGKKWGEPKRHLTKLPVTHYFMTTDNYHFYISTKPEKRVGVVDWCRLAVQGSDTIITSIGRSVNSSGLNLDFFIAPNESYIIVVDSLNHLSVSFRNEDGSWGKLNDLGEKINFGIGSWGPFVSADGQFLFYSTGTKPDYSDTHIHWARIKERLEELKTRQAKN